MPAVAVCPETEVTPARRATARSLSFKEQEGGSEGSSEAATSPLQKAYWPPTAVSATPPYRAIWCSFGYCRPELLPRIK